MKTTMNRSDWQAVRDALIADDRARLGEPPSVDELLAYERGELSNENAERVQQLLVAYPELARAYATPFPSDDAETGDPDYLAGDVIGRQWDAFRAANRSVAANVAGGAAKGRVLQFWPSVAAIAASVAIVFGAMLWQAHSNALRPHVLPEAAILTPDGGRGGAEPPQAAITPAGDSFLLVVSLIGTADYETYRIELVSSQSHKRLWSSEPLRVTSSNSFNVEIPSSALPAGTYQLIAYGLRGNAQEQVSTYTIDVRRRPAP
ncbi:MAG: hypothetical protein QOC81_2323 [Thermoanaerobaculia bacterium]|jgi:hypothetical protein|nr:hypothetical protein [Thermoanaerobaculia bacterium]